METKLLRPYANHAPQRYQDRHNVGDDKLESYY